MILTNKLALISANGTEEEILTMRHFKFKDEGNLLEVEFTEQKYKYTYLIVERIEQ